MRASRVLIAAQHLVDRARHEPERARELLELRQRFARIAAETEPSSELTEIALELRRLREELSAALANVESCSGCAEGHPLPFGRWPGGHCCGGQTSAIFTDDELAALALSGTTPLSLKAPRSDLAGCAFRGPSGCSLSPRDRPSLCVRYVCRELEGELSARGDWPKIKALKSELRIAFERFARVKNGSTPR